MRNSGYWATENAIRHAPETWTPTMRHVAVTIAWHVGEDLTCHPSDARLAEITGLSRRTVQRAVLDLERAGALHRRTGPYAAGGRERLIEWLHSPLVPLRLVVDNSSPGRSRTATGDASEPPPMAHTEPPPMAHRTHQ